MAGAGVVRGGRHALEGDAAGPKTTRRVGRHRGGNEAAASDGVGIPSGGGIMRLCDRRERRRVVGGFEVIDVGLKLRLLVLEVEVAGGVEGEHGVVLEGDARWFGEAFDV